MSEDLFLESLKLAVVKAFFEPIQTSVPYRNPDGSVSYSTQQIGGFGSSLTHHILQLLDANALAKDVAAEFQKRRDEQVEKLSSEIARIITRLGDVTTTDRNYYSYNASQVRPEILACVTQALKTLLENSPDFKDLMLKRIGIEDAAITINVQIVPKERK